MKEIRALCCSSSREANRHLHPFGSEKLRHLFTDKSAVYTSSYCLFSSAHIPTCLCTYRCMHQLYRVCPFLEKDPSINRWCFQSPCGAASQVLWASTLGPTLGSRLACRQSGQDVSAKRLRTAPHSVSGTPLCVVCLRRLYHPFCANYPRLFVH